MKAYAIEQPAHGQVRVSYELRRRGQIVSPSGVRSIWLRNELAYFKQRQRALESHVANTGEVLPEAQVIALERKREDDVYCGEIETSHPGFLGSQDAFYVGNMKGVGRIYQQTFVDTDAKIGFAKPNTTKTPITTADLLNDQVLPFFTEHQVDVLRVLTDGATESCGKVEQHDYQLYLAMNDIEHPEAKAASPQTNGKCERFQQTVLQELFQGAFRKKFYANLEELQCDLDEWMRFYNYERTHQGKMCCGRTPIETFPEGKKICQEKLIG